MVETKLHKQEFESDTRSGLFFQVATWLSYLEIRRGCGVECLQLNETRDGEYLATVIWYEIIQEEDHA